MHEPAKGHGRVKPDSRSSLHWTDLVGMAKSEIVLPEFSPAFELPLVSVVVPTYRRELLLCNTLQSLVGQTYRHSNACTIVLQGSVVWSTQAPGLSYRLSSI